MGHTFGVRVQKVLKVQRVQRGRWLAPAGLEVIAACGGGLCKRVVEKGFLRWTGPMGRRVRKFDGAFGPEGCGLPCGQCL